MATMYSTTRPLMLIGTLDIGGRFLVAREVFVRGCGGGVCMKPCGGATSSVRFGKSKLSPIFLALLDLSSS